MERKFVFSFAEDEIFINCVQKNKSIFDNSDPKHKDINFKEKIWKNISKAVGRTGTYTPILYFLIYYTFIKCNMMSLNKYIYIGLSLIYI